VLARGYSVTTNSSGEVIRTTTQAPPGTRITTRLADGSLVSDVIIDAGNSAAGQQPITPTRAPLPPRKSPAKSDRRGDPNQPGLFRE
jgi:hypothetical protein